MKRLIFVLLSSFGVIGTAHAQAQTQFGPDNGFFRPSPDVALNGAKSNSASQQQPFLTLQSPGMPAAPVAMPAVVTPMPVAVMPAPAPQPAPAPIASPSGPQPAQAAQASVERQMDRSVSEADRDRARAQAAPAGVGAAFDGSTSSENR